MGNTTIGLKATHVAALAFVFSFFIDSYIPLFFIVGYVALVEKDEWLTRQTVSALLLKTFFSCVFVVVRELVNQYISLRLKSTEFGDLSSLAGMAKQMSGGTSGPYWLLGVLSIVWLVFVAMGAYNVLKGKEAGIPVIQDLFEKRL